MHHRVPNYKRRNKKLNRPTQPPAGTAIAGPAFATCTGRWGLPLRGVRHASRQTFFWLRFFSAPKHCPRPPQRHATRTQTVGRRLHDLRQCRRRLAAMDQCLRGQQHARRAHHRRGDRSGPGRAVRGRSQRRGLHNHQAPALVKQQGPGLDEPRAMVTRSHRTTGASAQLMVWTPPGTPAATASSAPLLPNNRLQPTPKSGAAEAER